jgi:hypothetical protein
MKKIGIIVLFATMIIQAFSQEVTAGNKVADQKVTVADTNETARVIVGDSVLVIENNKDAVKMRIGDRGITILESLENNKPKVEFEKYGSDEGNRDNDQDKSDKDQKRYRRHFSGNWAGIEFGFNNYLTDEFTSVMPDDIYYMTLHSGKSNNFSINFIQQSIGLARHFGLVTGLGLEWNNYRFDGNNSIEKGENGVIVELDPEVTLKKSRLKTLYLNIPLLIEGKIPADNNHFNISGGIIGAVKLWSQTKMVTDDEKKLKSDSDFSLNVLRWGPTVRIGFGNLQIYGTYYFSPLFKTGKTPGGVELYPCEIGLALTFND